MRKQPFHTQLASFFCMFMLFVCTACVSSQSTSPSATATAVNPAPEDEKPVLTQQTEPPAEEELLESDTPPPFYHTIKWKGETLSVISGWYTGRINHWKDLVAANPEINPKALRIGNRILIPREILYRDRPMPASYLQRYLPKQKEAASETPVETSAPADKNTEVGSSPSTQVQENSIDAAAESSSPTVPPSSESSAMEEIELLPFGPKD